MSTLTFGTMKIRGHKVGKASWFPAIRELIHSCRNSADACWTCDRSSANK